MHATDVVSYEEKERPERAERSGSSGIGVAKVGSAAFDPSRSHERWSDFVFYVWKGGGRGRLYMYSVYGVDFTNTC